MWIGIEAEEFVNGHLVVRQKVRPSPREKRVKPESPRREGAKTAR